MSNSDLIKKLERELELTKQLAKAKEDNVKDVLVELFNNSDLRGQIAQELKGVKAQPAGRRGRDGFNSIVEDDSAVQPIDYDE